MHVVVVGALWCDVVSVAVTSSSSSCHSCYLCPVLSDGDNGVKAKTRRISDRVRNIGLFSQSSLMPCCW